MSLLDLLSFLKGDREEAAPPEMSLAEARSIAVAYGDLLKRAPVSSGSMVADVRELPHPKAKIKRALQVLYKATKDRRQRDALGVAYVSLASWQPGVGRTRVWFDLSGAQPDGTNDPAHEAARSPVAHDKWKAAINADTNRLTSDLLLLDEQPVR